MFRISSTFTARSLPLLFLLLITGFTATHAQTQDISYGLKGGLNIANHYDARFDTDPITTIQIGAFVNVQLGNTPFSLQPEVFYSKRFRIQLTVR